MGYKTNFLTNVILRVDFVSGEESIKQSLAPDVKNACIKQFPIRDEREVDKKHFIVNPPPDNERIDIKEERFTEWHFSDVNMKEELCITHSFLYLAVKEYSSYEELSLKFFDILKIFLSHYPQIKISRVGLRYIDQIKLPFGKTTCKDWFKYWSKYINNSLLHSLKFVEDNSKLSRQMNSIEMTYDRYRLRFQYGINNEDYPAPNKKNHFVIDTDVYATGLLDMEDVKDCIESFHKEAKGWFEKAIKQPLRDKMNEE